MAKEKILNGFRSLRNPISLLDGIPWMKISIKAARKFPMFCLMTIFD
jgi:hypothetical protein